MIINNPWFGVALAIFFCLAFAMLIRRLRNRESDRLALAAEELYESHPAGSDYDVDYEPSARFLSVSKANAHVQDSVGPAGHPLFGASRPTNAECWEYTGGDVPNKTQIDILNAYGRQGWEVILTKPNSTVTGAFDGTVYVLLKRKWYGLPHRNATPVGRGNGKSQAPYADQDGYVDLGVGRAFIQTHEPDGYRRPVRDNPQA